MTFADGKHRTGGAYVTSCSAHAAATGGDRPYQYSPQTRSFIAPVPLVPCAPRARRAAATAAVAAADDDHTPHIHTHTRARARVHAHKRKHTLLLFFNIYFFYFSTLSTCANDTIRFKTIFRR